MPKRASRLAFAHADEWAGESKVMVNAIDNDWELELRGDVHQLRGMSQSLSGYDIVIFNPIDDWNDTITNDFALCSWYFNGIEDHNQVYAIGAELIELLNGVCAIFDPNHSPFLITNLYQGNHKQWNIDIDDIPPLRLSELEINSTKYNFEKHEAAIRSDIRFYLIHLSKNRDDVYQLIKSFSNKPDFRSLYTTLEALEYYAKENSVDLTVDANQRNSFTHVSNNWGVLGAKARHGEKNWKPPKNPMSLSDATSFVRLPTKEYLTAVAKLQS